MFLFEMFGACVMVLVIGIKNIFLSFCILKKKCFVLLLIYLYNTYKENLVHLLLRKVMSVGLWIAI